MKRRFYQLDVFTRRPYHGSPLAVVTDADGLRPSQMQAIAREMNLPETVFVQKPTTNHPLARLRIFTPQRQELPLASRSIVGTWFLLAELGVVPAQEGAVRVLQQTGAGVLPVEIFFEEGRPRLVTITQRPARFRPARLDRKELTASLGLRARDIHARLPVEYVTTFISNLVIPLASPSSFARIEPNPSLLRKLLGGGSGMASCCAIGDRQVRARVVLPWELAEESTAAGTIGAYLVRHGEKEAGHPMQILQDIEKGRSCEIYVNVAQTGSELTPRISGSAVRVFEGHLEA
ncbi:MAG TPA: PhzF family phenazine biosynthesis protein [Candidatus Dormibacteraeota bacterium]|nr:PhzF family phenazine biosynthesis protein [Candidatus Dormibacteraeota bacterium]